jgi:hypothetical protein
VEEIFLSRERVVGLDGIAGAGKTTTLAVVREGAESTGYKVEGFAPTYRAAQTLGGAGIESMTLQMHLVRGQRADTGEHRLYVLDESSLASTRQMHEFIERLHRTTGYCWWATLASMNRSKPAASSRSYRTRA